MSSIGIMDGAFFVGRKEIIDWINSTLDLNLSKVEETANGAVACQLLDVMYPTQVPMNKINWSAKQDFEFIANYKILQTCFNKLGIEKHVDVDRLITAKYMDNLEFMQWFKRFFEMHVQDKGDYDAFGQRSKGKGGASYHPISNVKKSTSAAASKTASTTIRSKSASATSKPSSNTTSSHQEKENQHNAAPSAASVASSRAVASEKGHKESKETTIPSTASIAPSTASTHHREATHAAAVELENANKEISNLRNALEESRKSFSELKLDYDGLEKERGFYFDKLRDIEMMLQELEDKGENNDLMTNMFKVLYATADGFDNTGTVGGNGMKDEEQNLHTLTTDSRDLGGNEVIVTSAASKGGNDILDSNMAININDDDEDDEGEGNNNSKLSNEIGHNASEETY
jgi:RP/EB family microtubule-associated protein